jgi:hypothetical protein
MRNGEIVRRENWHIYTANIFAMCPYREFKLMSPD